MILPSSAGFVRRSAGRWGGGPGGRPSRYRLRTWLALTVAAVALASTGAGVGWHYAQQSGARTARPVRIYKVPVHHAPGFTLTDQSGRPLALSSLRGKAVALYFMDPRCRDVCPLVAQEFIDADRDLGAAASHVALVGVDVNPGYLGRRWLTAFDAQHGLNQLANWHFVTGSLRHLRQVWTDYSVQVQVTNSGELQHTTVIDFIGPHGKVRALAAPYATVRNGTGYLPAGQLSRWGRRIAGELRQLAEQPGGNGS